MVKVLPTLPVNNLLLYNSVSLIDFSASICPGKGELNSKTIREIFDNPSISGEKGSISSSCS
jgi:hypothetical protein